MTMHSLLSSNRLGRELDRGNTDRPAPTRKPVPVANRSSAVLAPTKPSPDMLALGARAGGVSVEVAWRIYRAMLEAAAETNTRTD